MMLLEYSENVAITSNIAGLFSNDASSVSLIITC